MPPVYLESRPGRLVVEVASVARSSRSRSKIGERSSQRADRCRVFGVDVPQTHPKRSAKGIAGCCLPDVALLPRGAGGASGWQCAKPRLLKDRSDREPRQVLAQRPKL